MGKMGGGGLTTDHFDTERRTELDIKCLQILRAVIYNQIILIDEEDKERNPKKYRRYNFLFYSFEKKSLLFK